MNMTRKQWLAIEKHYESREGNKGISSPTGLGFLPHPDPDCRPVERIGTRIKDGDRSIRLGATVECFDAVMWPDVYGRERQDVTGQVWSRASKPGHWFVVSEQGYAYEVHQKAMRVVQGVGEQQLALA